PRLDAARMDGPLTDGGRYLSAEYCQRMGVSTMPRGSTSDAASITRCPLRPHARDSTGTFLCVAGDLRQFMRKLRPPIHGKLCLAFRVSLSAAPREGGSAQVPQMVVSTK